VGFDSDAVDRWIGLGGKVGSKLSSKIQHEDLETCPRKSIEACATPP
jgi:hypothetical protein